MAAALPEGWTQHEDKEGFAYFYSSSAQHSTYEHPMDEFYRKVYQRAKSSSDQDPARLVSAHLCTVHRAYMVYHMR